MPKRKTTTVEFTKKGERLKNRYCVVFGLKGVLSVGLELFDGLSDDDKLSRVTRALELDGNKGAIRAIQSNVALLSELVGDLLCASADAMTDAEKRLVGQMHNLALVDEASAALSSRARRKRTRRRPSSEPA